MKRIRRSKRLLRKDRGSALLVSLMVIVGLSLLGLGFVAISETETAIAKNQQNVLQTQAIAEAGAKMVVEWFQDPVWGQTIGAMPGNDPATNANLVNTKIPRVAGAYSGVYKPNATTRLLDKPYRPAGQDRFYGDENTGDIVINRTTDQASLDNFNDTLLGASAEDKRTGEVTEVRIYAPPIVGGILTPNGAATNPDGTSQQFWVGGERYGVATIKVTAQQFRDTNLTGNNKYASSNVMSMHSVKLVVGELPLPIPAGPIQGNASVSFGGNFRVHWGMETATTTLDPSLALTAVPWANAYERTHFEHGYETGNSVASITIVSGGSGYAAAPVVTIAPPPAGTTATATATVNAGVVTAITITSRGSGYAMWPPPAVTFAGGGGAGASGMAVVGAEAWPVTGGQFDSDDFFHEIIGKTYQDPWYGARAMGDNLMDGATPNGVNPMCYPYNATADEDTTVNPSFAFQWQSVNNFPWQKKILFPVIKYDFWKKIAQTGRGFKGVYYFKHAGGQNFTKFGQGAAQRMAFWVNTQNGANLGPGVYFFDTVTGKNPQILTGAARTAELTPATGWSSGDFNGGMLMEGFIYMNSLEYGTTGGGNSQTTIQANYPGEPFRDIGYPRWDAAATNWDLSCGGQICRINAGDGVHSYQDLNGNGRFDAVVMVSPTFNSRDPGNVAHANEYVPKVWKSVAQATADYGAPCSIPAAGYNGTNAAGTDCSEPHEPYINLIFQATAAPPANGQNPNPVPAKWEAPNAQTYQPKNLDSAGVPIPCPGTPDSTVCTSNAYDVDGGIVPLDVILYGILYNEGQFGSAGNCWYYGSVLIQDNVGATGTADVWFDEKLIKGTWAPPNMPRVIVFNEQTDEEQQ